MFRKKLDFGVFFCVIWDPLGFICLYYVVRKKLDSRVFVNGLKIDFRVFLFVL